MFPAKGFLISFLIILISATIYYLNGTKTKHPEAGLDVVQLITKYGYPLEIHEVVTEDGYILTLHRIPHGRKKSNVKRIPVLLMHGFLNSATEFVNLGPDNALSLLLADRNYDVWLANARGTTFSRKHVKLNPDTDAAFWDFSFHEIGIYDVPNSIDYILEKTGEKKLHYIGYSQGAISFFIAISEKPEYADKIRLMTSLAPALFIGNQKSPTLRLLVYIENIIKFIINNLHLNEILAHHGIFSKIIAYGCEENSIFFQICYHQLSVIAGYNEEQLNQTLFSVIFANTPGGVSSTQLLHLIQSFKTGFFQKFDYGVEKNLLMYQNETPPMYNLSNATMPVAVYYAKNDWAIETENVEKLIQLLPNVVLDYLVPLETFTHNDFLHAKDAAEILYNPVIKTISEY